MRSVTLFDGTTIPVIGLGTWSMGGGSQPDHSQDGRAMQALHTALAMGYRHIDTAEMYAHGHTEELVGQALRGLPRQQLFITTKVRPPNLRYTSVLRSLDGSLKRMACEYIDLFLVHWPSGSTPMEETFKALNQAVREGKVRYLGVSNFNVQEMKHAQELSETPIVTNQVPYSLETRRYVKNGVIPYCQANGIIVTAYSPVEEGRLRSRPALTQIAIDLGATPFQIALAWLVNQAGVIAIPMSHDEEHLRQNLQAGEIKLSEQQMAALDLMPER